MDTLATRPCFASPTGPLLTVHKGVPGLSSLADVALSELWLRAPMLRLVIPSSAGGRTGASKSGVGLAKANVDEAGACDLQGNERDRKRHCNAKEVLWGRE